MFYCVPCCFVTKDLLHSERFWPKLSREKFHAVRDGPNHRGILTKNNLQVQKYRGKLTIPFGMGQNLRGKNLVPFGKVQFLRRIFSKRYVAEQKL